MASYEFHNELAVAGTLSRIENSMSLLESVANEGAHLCSSLYDYPVYPTKPSDRYVHRGATVRSASGGVLVPASHFLGRPAASSRGASPVKQQSRSRATSGHAAERRYRDPSPVAGETPVWDRLISSSHVKEAELLRRRQAAEAFRIMHETDNCTFQPHTNVSNHSNAKDTDPHQRLYFDAKRIESKKAEQLKATQARREKEMEREIAQLQCRRNSETMPTNTNGVKFWDRLYSKPEKRTQTPPKPRPNPHQKAVVKPQRVINETVKRLYGAAMSQEDRRQELVRRFEQQREQQRKQEMANAGLHRLNNNGPFVPQGGAMMNTSARNAGSRQPSPTRLLSALKEAAPQNQQQQHYYTVPQPVVDYTKPADDEEEYRAAGSTPPPNAAANVPRSISSDSYEEPTFTAAEPVAAPQIDYLKPAAAYMPQSARSDASDASRHRQIDNARVTAATPPPEFDELSDDGLELTPTGMSYPEPKQPLPKLNLDKALLGTANN